MKIVFTGGGSGGHIIPIIAVARELKKLVPVMRFHNKKGILKQEKLEMYYIGPKSILQTELIKEGVIVKNISTGKIRRYISFSSVLLNVFDILIKIPFAIIHSFFILLFIRPKCVFSKGGYGAFPVSFSAFLLRKKIILHESDIVSGLANKILANFADKVLVSFKETHDESAFDGKSIYMGNPIRSELVKGDKTEALKYFSFIENKKILFILGGSQGAQKINDITLSILEKLIIPYQIIHQCGKKNYKQVKRESDVLLKEEEKNGYRLYGFMNEQEMKNAYSCADLVISRSGAGSIFEIAINEIPSILIPLSGSAQNHQSKNAYAYKGGVVLEESNASVHMILDIIKNILTDDNKINEMKKIAREFSTPLATQDIAKYLRDCLIS